MQTHYAGSSLDELLADDLIQTMMDADHVNPAAVRSLFCVVARTSGARNAAAAGPASSVQERPQLTNGSADLTQSQPSASACAGTDHSQVRTRSDRI